VAERQEKLSKADRPARQLICISLFPGYHAYLPIFHNYLTDYIYIASEFPRCIFAVRGMTRSSNVIGLMILVPIESVHVTYISDHSNFRHTEAGLRQPQGRKSPVRTYPSII